MESLLYISAIIVAIAFAVLVGYLVLTLKSANRTLDHVANTMAGLEKQVNGITHETELLLSKTNRLADDVQQKTESLNTVFASVKELGDSVQQVNRSIRHVSGVVSNQAVKQSEQIAQAVQWGNVAIDFYTKFKARKARQEQTSTLHKEEI
ncbi:DUF948 domain-containing protein [Alkalihalophilus lindianensis]|uniref:DUF948 domain-containing protein n=1 Tax=Alkalihalophilus lindianensis TaxID=1630542 RepID=A0ABU3XAA0_9BACI|nr:DUF948 domain-containing protein [Alkalihalophilus lindianensis]MDV2684733.1 DUF948 domain-containing protein [Alkalihalophilus lindianensis]